jgi:adenosylhomocysteine nucleosidase
VPKIAIIAALEHELRPLIRFWSPTKAQHEGRDFTFYESPYAVAVCSGIGPEPGRRAAEAIIALYSPELLISAGIAGGLTPDLKIGETIFPATVIDGRDSSRHQTSIQDAPIGSTPLAKTILVSYPEIASAEQKLKLGKAYGAHAVDMEGVSVALAAEAHGLPFLAIKSISDVVDFELPEMMPFVRDGQFQAARFALHVAFRPWLWLKVFRLARNTKLASENLCAWLRESALTNTIVPGIRTRKNAPSSTD